MGTREIPAQYQAVSVAEATTVGIVYYYLIYLCILANEYHTTLLVLSS